MIRVEEVHKSYGSAANKFEILKGVSLETADGGFTVILGASGSGKSTLLNVVSGLERPDSGRVIYDGEDISELSDDKLTAFRKRKIGFIFQQYYLLPNLTVARTSKWARSLRETRTMPRS